MRQGGCGRRAAASEQPVRSYLPLGRVFDLTTHATSNPSEQIDPPTCVGPMSARFLSRLRPHMVATILLDQWVDEQTAIETAKDNGTGRYRRLAFLNHQTLAFLTGHRAPPA